MTTEKYLVCTGRYHAIHHGHVSYLKWALRRANEEERTFMILTGPTDEELPAGAIAFPERSILLQTLLEIEGLSIKCNSSSPNLNDDGLTASWISSFFIPIEGLGPHADVLLVVPKKQADYYNYFGGPLCHYSDLLMNYWGGEFKMRTLDYFSESGHPADSPLNKLSASELGDLSGSNDLERYRRQPAAAFAALLLAELEIKGPRFERIVRGVNSRFPPDLATNYTSSEVRHLCVSKTLPFDLSQTWSGHGSNGL